MLLGPSKILVDSLVYKLKCLIINFTDINFIRCFLAKIFVLHFFQNSSSVKQPWFK